MNLLPLQVMENSILLKESIISEDNCSTRLILLLSHKLSLLLSDPQGNKIIC